MSALYTIFIYPLELLFEVVFTIANRIIGHPGWAIIILSLAVNFLVLPLYNRADAVQKDLRILLLPVSPRSRRLSRAMRE